MVVTYPIPEGEVPSEDYEISVNGQKAEAYRCRVSAIPFNTVWPGYQRPLGQTEMASFLYFDVSGGECEEAEVEIVVRRGFKEATMRPLSKTKGRYEANGKKVTFKIGGPGHYTLETDGFHNALHIFINPVKNYGADKTDPKLIYFGPGVHRPGKIELKSGNTLFIDGGAVVHASVVSENASGIRIIGHGILDNSEFFRSNEETDGQKGSCAKFYGCSNIEVDGVIFRDSSEWTLTTFGCQNIKINNAKAIGMWRYNSDGFDLCNSKNAVISNCFLRCFDDCIVLKGFPGKNKKAENVENIYVEKCVVWCDWGRGLEIGAETCADEFRNIIFKDCDLIHNAHIAMDIQNSGYAHVHKVSFENIRVEYSRHCDEPICQNFKEMEYASKTKTHSPYLMLAELHSYYHDILVPGHAHGKNSDIEFDGIYVTSDSELPIPESVFRGLGENNDTSGIRIKNLYFNGEKSKSLQSANVRVGDYASDIRLDE
ncbi:MAG: glycosyl hydrolase family 28 protein [Oscillospiraceae bacterium]|nr:glycosyl hydrolase family 28 protein [Oscillospiraceae bacterium]